MRAGKAMAPVGRALALVGLALACLFFVGRVFLPSLASMTHSYPGYYTAARLVLEGKWSPHLYDDPWFEARVLERTDGRVSEHFSLHPPVTSLLLVPISWLDMQSARVVWQLLNLGLFAAALWLILSALKIEPLLWRIVFVALALVFTPLAENFRVGQTYVLVLFLFALALWAQLRDKPLWTGVGLGLAGGLKLSGGPIFLLLVVRKEWRAVMATVGVGIATVLLGLVLGWDGTVAFLGRLASAGQPMPLAAHVAFQTTPSFLQRVFVASPNFNPAPLIDAPWVSTWLNLLLAGAALGVMLWLGRHAEMEVAFAAAVTLNVILFPTAIEYHYTLLLIPLAVMGKQLIGARTALEVVWSGVLLVLLYLPFDWNAPRWSEGAWMLLAYPRLYGGWLLWLWLTRKMVQAARVHPIQSDGKTRQAKKHSVPAEAR